ncbi:hypothetical protein Tco_0082106, partial [Tanacetum coccineum]
CHSSIIDDRLLPMVRRVSQLIIGSGITGGDNCSQKRYHVIDGINGIITDKCTDISNITRKPSRTGKPGHEKRKSTKEARNAKPK